jgi:hypothetical protein
MNNTNLFFVINNHPQQGIEGSVSRKHYSPDLLICYPYDVNNMKKIDLKDKYISLFEINILNKNYIHKFKDNNDIDVVHIRFDKVTNYFTVRGENDYTPK